MKRRQFVKGCCCAGIAAMSGSNLNNLVYAQDHSSTGDIFIQVFLRGGMDALSFLAPHGDPDYYYARERLAMDSSQVLDVDGYFGLHPQAAPLKEIYDQGHLALIPACGLPDVNRSHFEAQDSIERGQEGLRSGGWLGRHLSQASNGSVFSGVSMDNSIDTSLESFSPAIALSGLNGFSLQGNSDFRNAARRSLRMMYKGNNALHEAAMQALDLNDIMEANPPGEYIPQNDVAYPNTSVSRTMTSLAQLIRLDLGLQAATVNYGGWDTHESQAGGDPSTGQFSDLVRDLSQALAAFWNDLSSHHGRVTMFVISEFGRRVRENDNRGTDHGHGGLAMVFNSDLTEKKIWGEWPGLATDQLYQRVDLDITTDYRVILGEILLARLNQGNLPGVFPEYNFQNPLGLFGVTTPVNDWAVF